MKESFTQSRAKAYAEYRDLVAADSGKSADAARVRQLMDQLKIGMDQLKADQQVLVQIPILLSQIQRGTGLDPARQEAQKAIEESADEIHRVLGELQARHNKLVNHSRELADLNLQAQEAVGRLATLKQQNPELLAQVPDLTSDDLNPAPAKPPDARGE